MIDARPRSSPGVGFGVRGETETFAVDVSFLNLAVDFQPVDEVKDLFTGSLLKIEGLRFFTPHSSRSAYAGGGMSWGSQSLGRPAPPGGGATSWAGHGLQAEFTAGYELARKSPVRFFVQADATAPLYAAYSETFAYPRPGEVVSTSKDSRYVPTVVVSAGVGWRRPRR
ncbi:MAG TPA: hypothetical protein VGQ37_25935 [Vicinamibacterales bacterium]|nr:hypothetical protein [Vicinamibacterales bacterium]